MKTFAQFVEAKDGAITQKHVKAHLKTLPHVTGKYDPAYGEWRIRLKGAKKGGEDGYFTTAHDDAIDSATAMNKEVETKAKK